MRKRREIVTVSEEFKFRGKAVSSAVIDDDDDYEIESGSETELDLNEMDARNAEIDDLTSEYILNLIYVEGYDLEDLGIEAQQLEAIEDAIEEILYEHGLTIYRPIIVEDEDGSERIVSSKYEALDE